MDQQSEEEQDQSPEAYDAVNLPQKTFEDMDCVLYLHTHSANRVQGNFLREWMVLKGKALLVFDFHGAGHSEGKYVTFGYFETLDIDAVDLV